MILIEGETANGNELFSCSEAIAGSLSVSEPLFFGSLHQDHMADIWRSQPTYQHDSNNVTTSSFRGLKHDYIL